MKVSDKIGVTLIITGAVLVATWYIFVYRKNKAGKDAQSEIEDQKKQVGNEAPSYTNGQFLQMANAIESAVNRVGTDETALYNNIGQLLNNADAHELNKAFGIRDERSLGSWLQSDGELSQVHEILKAKGITYRFNIIDNSPFYDF